MMQLRMVCAACLALSLPGLAAAEAADAPQAAGITPFFAHYVAEWKGITVGTSDLQLQQDGPDHYLYKWTISARGIFRIVYSSDLTQKSWFSVVADHVRPERYFAEEGASSVSLAFDWDAGRAQGMSENKPVDLHLEEGAQDLMSIQIEVMLDLKNGNLPALFHIVDKDQLKDFLYSREGTATVRTAIGQLETVIVSSRRSGNDRILRMWFAPSLGFIPVQAERSRDGKIEFAMRIKSMKR
jgi:hypothetical protein